MSSNENKPVVVPREFLDFLRAAPVGAGYCMCGSSEANHQAEDHGYVDMWDYTLTSWLERIEQSQDSMEAD